MGANDLIDYNKNPFPGLRPFQEDEDFLFFGRESQVDVMVNKLAATKFLAVVGTSGSGKSSLVNCGLRPALYSGLMTSTSTDWRIAKLRPGNDPIGALASALSEDGLLFRDFQNRGMRLEEIMDTTLRMSKLGLIDAYEQSQMGNDVNLLVIVDQFEELFRYRRLDTGLTDSGNQAEAVAFVNLLLEAVQQRDYPIYVVITMRSDFLGDCSQFQGLAEAINFGQYLVPRLTREERRAAISGPIKVAGADILPVLLTRLVNDVGDNPDQLSILQHALNRTWAYWQYEGGASGPIELKHYQAIGTMSQALNNHAEKAYHELQTSRQRHLCEKLFKVLTDTASDPRGVRRPTTLGTLCAIVDAGEAEITKIIDVFRKPSRSFLMPPMKVALNGNSVVDISHESLMRVWSRLRSWASEEALSAQMYLRLANTSRLHDAGKANLWRDPDLQLALDWKKKEKPIFDWAEQYDHGFEQAMAFLKKSKETRDYDIAESRFARKLRQFRTVFLIMALALLSYSLLWKASSDGNVGDYALGDKVQTALRSQLTVALPPKVFYELENSIKEKGIKSSNWTGQDSSNNKSYPLFSDGSTKMIEALKLDSAGHIVFHIYKAMEKYDFRLPHVVLLKGSTSNANQTGNVDVNVQELWQDLWVQENRILKRKYNRDFDPVFGLMLDNIRNNNDSLANLLEKHKLEFERQGIVLLPPEFNVRSPQAEELRLVPASFKVLGSEPSKKILFAMQAGLKDLLLQNPTRVNRVEGILTIFFYILGYLAFVSVFDIVYRKLAFHPLGQSPLDRFWRGASSGVKGFLNLFKSRWWAILFSVALFIIASLLMFIGWADTLNFAIILSGLIVLLSVPLKPLMGPYWSLRFKAVQGLVLKLLGFYLLSLCIVNFFNPVFSLGRSLVLAFVGIALIMLGNKKRSLSAGDKLLQRPDRPPVLYFRSPIGIDQSSKNELGRLMGYGFRTVDEKVLANIFGALGPFVPLTSLKELKGLKGHNADNGSTKKQYKPIDVMSSSALVILQIEHPLTDHMFTRLEQALQNLGPKQLLLYFSQEIAAENLSSSYYQFAKETESVFPHVLPDSIGSNRVIAFREDWRPYLCGAVSHPKIWWAKLLPLLAKRLDITRRRRSLVRTLKPFFENKGLVPGKARLHSDFSIGLAAFLPLGSGLPAGIMIFRNLWLMGRKGLAFLGLIVHIVGVVIFLILLLALIGVVSDLPGLTYRYQDQATYAVLIMATIGFPFVTYWLWRRISGRKIRYQTAFSGLAQPWWVNLLVIGITSTLLWTPAIIPLFQDMERSASNSKLWEGQDLASAGKIEEAIVALREAQNLEPGIDLDPYTEGVQNDPRTAAEHLAAKSKVWAGYDLASAGKVDEAVVAMQEAQNLYSGVDLNPDTPNIEQDPKEVVAFLGNQARAKVMEGYNLASTGKVEAAIVAFQQAQNLEPAIDLDPYKEGIQNDPKSVAAHLVASSKVEEAYNQAFDGRVQEAIATLQEAQKLKPEIDLDPYSEMIQNEPGKVANGWAVTAKVTGGINEAKKGEFEKAQQAFSEAIKLDPTLNEDASSLNNVGWWLSLGGYPEAAIIPSENAVKFAANNPNLLGHCLDTRGLARALTGDIAGAIKDFEAAIASNLWGEEMKSQRQGWIEMLRKGEQPFTAELLEKLKGQ